MANKTKLRSGAVKTKPKSKMLVAVIAICVVVAVVVSALLLATPKRTPVTYEFNKSVASGVDISEHNGTVDWDKLAEDYDFAFIRVGYRGYGNGNITEDKYARENLENAQKAGIPVGVYFYTQATTEKEAVKEASFVVDIIKHYDVQLPVIIDYEYPSDSDGKQVGRLVEADFSPTESANIINAFISRLEDKGYYGGVYASSYMFASKIDCTQLNKNAVIWVADYNKKVSFDVDYDIWQYSEKGKSDAVESSYVDLNYWYTSN